LLLPEEELLEKIIQLEPFGMIILILKDYLLLLQDFGVELTLNKLRRN